MGRDKRSETSSSATSRSRRDDKYGHEDGSRRSKQNDDRRVLERTMSGNRGEERSERRKKDKERKRSSRSRTMDDYPAEDTHARAQGSGGERMGMEIGGSGSFSAQVGASGFNPFPGQDDPASGRPPSPSHMHSTPATSSHVQDQFPGQNPTNFTEPYRPPVSANDDGPGLAAEYYGDQGESVAFQPGVRPQGPSVIVGAEPHLVAASSVPAPPVETGAGSAQDYYADDNSQNDHGNDYHQSSSKPSKPSKHGKHSSASGVAAASAGAALGYAASHGTAASQTSVIAAASQSGVSSIHGHMASAPEVPTLGNTSDRPDGKHEHHSNAGLYAAGAAGLAAGAYAMGHSGKHDKPSTSHPAAAYSETSAPHGPRPPYVAGGAIAYRDTDRGPLRKFVDWWKDHEDVRKMEEYTEYIGVCHGCFDPGTTPADAPRRHHHHGRRRRRRPGDHSHGRIDKGSRYGSSSSSSSSSDSDGGPGAASWLGTAAAGYGLYKLGKSFLGGSDSESSSSSGSGSNKHKGKSNRRYKKHGVLYYGKDGRKVSSVDDHDHRYHGGTVGRRNSQPQGLGHGEVLVDGKNKQFVRRRRSRSSSGSSSSSQSHSGGGKTALVGAGVGLAAGAAAASYLGRKGSRSPEAAAVVTRRRSRSGDRIATGVVAHSQHPDSSHRHHPHYATVSHHRHHNNHQQHHHHQGHPNESTAVFVRRKPSKRKVKSKGGFFNFGNGSSSSEEGLAFGGGGLSRRHSTKRKSSDEKLNAALLGLGATAGALAVAKGASTSKGSKRSSRIYMEDRQEHVQQVNAEDGWESASDGDASSVDGSSVSSADSGLAFGGAALYGLKNAAARSSQESLSSDVSGTDKWDWRWGSKRKKKKRRNVGSVAAAAAATAAVAGGAMAASTGSLPSMQHIHPVQTTDPTRFDSSSRRTPSVSSVQTPLVTSTRPEPTPVQPQPVRPVSNAVFSTQAAAYPSVSTAAAGPRNAPPYDPSPQPFPSYDEGAVSSQFAPGPGHMHHSSTLPAQQFKEQAMATGRPDLSRRGSLPSSMSNARDAAIAGVAAGSVVSALSNGKSKKKDRSVSAGVRFHGVEGDMKQPEEPGREETDRRSERRRQREEARQERLRRDDERERQRQAQREESERRRKVEESRRYELERHEASKPDEEIHAAEQHRELVTTKPSDMILEKVDTGAKQDTSNFPMTAALAGGAAVVAAAAATAVISTPDEGIKVVKAREIAPGPRIDLDEEAKSAIFDPDYFQKRKAAKESQGALRRRPSAEEIVADLEQRYQEKPQSMANFFAPPELLDQNGNVPAYVKSVDVKSINGPEFAGSRDVEVFHTPYIVTVEPPTGMPPPSSIAFNVSRDKIDLQRIAPPWNVPMLNLIEPTPPGSLAGSTSGGSSVPHSPASTTDGSVKEKEGDEANMDVSRSGSVSWGQSQTMVLHDGSVPAADAQGKLLLRCIVGSDYEGWDLVANAFPVDEDVEEVIGETDIGKDEVIVRSTSPEVEPVVIEPDDERDDEHAPRTVPVSTLFEVVSGLENGDAIADGSRAGEGFVEGEVPETPADEKPNEIEDDKSREVVPTIEEREVEGPIEPILSKKQKAKQKKKDKAAKRQSKNIDGMDDAGQDNDRGGFDGDAGTQHDDPADASATKDAEAATNGEEATKDDAEDFQDAVDKPSDEWAMPTTKKSKKGKNRKSAKFSDFDAPEEPGEGQRAMVPFDANDSAVIVASPKEESYTRDEGLNGETDRSIGKEGEAKDDDDGDFQFTSKSKKGKKNKKGRGAKGPKDVDDWTEPTTSAESRELENEKSEPAVEAKDDGAGVAAAAAAAASAVADSLSMPFVSKKEKKKLKKGSKWNSIISAFGSAPAEEAENDDISRDAEPKVNGDGDLSEAGAEDTGVDRRNGDDKVPDL